MSPPKSPLAYAHLRSVLDRALESERGIKIACDTEGKAKNLQQRLNTCRKMDRDENLRLYAPEDPKARGSVYDVLSFQVKGNDVYIVKLDEVEMEIEEL